MIISNKPKLYLLISFLLLLPCLASLAQFHTISNKASPSEQHSLNSFLTHNKVDTIKLEFKVTSIVLQIDKQDYFNNSYIIAEDDTISLSEDEHQSGKEDEERFSNLIIFNEPINYFILYKGDISGRINFHFINTGDTPKIFLNQNNKRLNEGCGKPFTIDQSQWRAGLSPPNYTPSYTKVKHIIVHHSAGSNTNADYTSVVRQIYIYHTQVRGFSDIAYNYLIAQDGTIFQGREGAGADEENVLGAHFCNKNNETMGICLLGDYEIAYPSESSLTSLVNIVGWKLKKEGLDPFGSSMHPPGSASAINLSAIAGHRDGCSDACPGSNVYSRLNEVRQRSAAAIKNLPPPPSAPLVVSNEREGPGEVKLKVTGGVEGNYIWYTSLNTKDSIPGAHFSEYVTPHQTKNTTYYVSARSDDCVSVPTAVVAKININQAYIFPNPSSGEVNILLKEQSAPYTFLLTNSIGQTFNFITPHIRGNLLSFNVSNLASGVYIITLSSTTQTFSRRIQVN